MSGDIETLVVALIGGVGGALLTGIFTALTSVWADKRRKQHELDAWLRQQRFTLIGDLLDFINGAATVTSPPHRQELAGDLHDRYVRVMMVIPDTLVPVLRDSVDHIANELQGKPSTRSVKSISWQSAYLQRSLTSGLGWDQEPVGRGCPGSRGN